MCAARFAHLAAFIEFRAAAAAAGALCDVVVVVVEAALVYRIRVKKLCPMQMEYALARAIGRVFTRRRRRSSVELKYFRAKLWEFISLCI